MERWHTSSADHPEFTSADYVNCYAEAYPDRRVEIVSPRQGVTFAFAVDGDTAVSILPVVPYLTSDARPAEINTLDVSCMQRKLGVRHLLFRLMYEDEPRTQAFLAIPCVRVFRRRGSAIIDWSAGGADVEERVKGHLGRQAVRRQRTFESLHLIAVSIADPDHATSIVTEVERQSWKSETAQDLVSKCQLDLYASLLRARILHAVAVLDGSRPVAYRLDGRNEAVLLCVQWSYDDRYARASPGFHLIAADLPHRYRNVRLSHVDLFGGEDMLKQVVMTGLRSRVDVVYPDDDAAAALVRAGLERDRAAEDHLRSQRGLRYFYTTRAWSQ
jgi:hypothetical protein